MDTQSPKSVVPALSAMGILLNRPETLDESQRVTLQKLCELVIMRFDYGEKHADAAQELCMTIHDSGILKTGRAENTDQIIECIDRLRNKLN